MSYKRIILKSGKDASLKRFHPWVFSGAIKQQADDLDSGDLVSVYSNKNDFLGTGHYQNGSITVRIISFEDVPIDDTFWQQKLGDAVALRQDLGLLDDPETTCCRIIHGEGDGLPGLIIDYYAGIAVLQAHDVGMFLRKQEIAEALKAVLGDKLTAVFDKSKSVLNLREFPGYKNGFLLGEGETIGIKENGHKFQVDFADGQKTGFFVDQRENRKLLGTYSKGKRVLNTFAYTGGFSVFALAGGAVSVDSVEVSKKIAGTIDQHIATNFGEDAPHQTMTEDALKYLDHMEEGKYDLIVLDPPAFAKHRGARINALKGYRRINQRAFEKIEEGGIVFTFSCSQVISQKDFRETVFSAAALAKRNIRILHQLHQPADHPINIYHPEGEYLKGLVLHVGGRHDERGNDKSEV